MGGNATLVLDAQPRITGTHWLTGVYLGCHSGWWLAGGGSEGPPGDPKMTPILGPLFGLKPR